MHSFQRFARAVAAVCAIAFVAPAAAQPRQHGFAEIAADLTMGLCPLFLAEELSLTAPELAERGFGTALTRKMHPSHGEVQTVELKRAEGAIAFGGVPGRFCTVVMMGEGRSNALAQIKRAIPDSGLSFQSAAHEGPRLAGMTIEAFRAEVEGQFLHLQLLQMVGPTPANIAQMYVTEE